MLYSKLLQVRLETESEFGDSMILNPYVCPWHGPIEVYI
jgi:hypothetical protein